MAETSNVRLARLLTLVPWLTAHSGVSKAAAAAHFGLTIEQLESDLELITFTGPGLYGGELVDIYFDDETITVYSDTRERIIVSIWEPRESGNTIEAA